MRMESLENAVEEYFRVVDGFLDPDPQKDEDMKQYIAEEMALDSNKMSATEISDVLRVEVYSCENDICSIVNYN